ncbi:hypothetical protein Bpfe_014807, partial [Biomphalaria pfeifferi]
VPPVEYEADFRKKQTKKIDTGKSTRLDLNVTQDLSIVETVGNTTKKPRDNGGER